MEFSLSEEQTILRKEIVRFSRNELNEGVAERDRDQEFPRDLWLKCGDMGLMGLPVPAEHGGSGLDPVTTAVAVEALGYGCEDGGLVFSLVAHLVSCVVPIWKHGSDEQKERYLPGLCDGSRIGIHAMTEPDSGSDAFAMRTTATPSADGYSIRGSKTFITNGPIADVVLVLALTDEEKRFHGGVTAFLVERDAAGFEAEAKLEKMGLRTSPLGELRFDDVEVSSEAIVGGLGGGGQIFTLSMDWERVLLFAAHAGAMERLLETAVKYARTRQQFGKSIGSFQAVSHRIADMKVRLEAARLLVYKAAWNLERTRSASLDASIAKLFVSEAYVEAAKDLMQIHGGYGYTKEYGIERELRDALGATIYSGTSEMQRNIIARWLGL